jgi:hypothetical protein
MSEELFDSQGRPIPGRPLSTGQETGNTTNAYVTALDWDTRFLRDKSMLLKNTHGSNDLKYKLLVLFYYGGADHEEVAEHSLAFGEDVTFQYLKPYARIKLQLKAAVADSQASYQVDYIGYGV